MKKYLFSGLIILLPLTLTVWLFWYLLDLFTNPFLEPIMVHLQDVFPGLTENSLTFLSRMVILIGIVIFTFLLGVIVRWFFIRSLFSLTQKLLSKIPVLKTIYRISKDIAEAFFSDKKEEAFRYPVAAPFPSEKSYTVSFSTGTVPPCCQEKVQEKLTCVFVPTAPHPISGYLLLLPENLVHKLEMTNEEAVRFTVSCGLVTPEKPSS